MAARNSPSRVPLRTRTSLSASSGRGDAERTFKTEPARRIIPSLALPTDVGPDDPFGAVVGFIFTVMDARRKTGEIGLNAVDPKLQGRGIGRAMYEFALNNLKERGAEMPASGPAGMPPMHRREEPMKRLDSTRQFPACISSKCCSGARSRHVCCAL